MNWCAIFTDLMMYCMYHAYFKCVLLILKDMVKYTKILILIRTSCIYVKILCVVIILTKTEWSLKEGLKTRK